MKRLTLLAAVAGGVLAFVPLGADAAKNPCAEHGFLQYARVDGTTFKNAGQCTVYWKGGGQLVPLSGPTVIVTSAGLSDGVLVFDYSASHFTPGSQVTQLHYVSAAYGIDDFDVAASDYTIEDDGTVSIEFGTTVQSACVPGATVTVTVADAAGDTATGSGPITCS